MRSDEPSVPSKNDEIEREPEDRPETCRRDSPRGGRHAGGPVYTAERLPDA